MSLTQILIAFVAIFPLQHEGHHGVRDRVEERAKQELSGVGINVNGIAGATDSDLSRMHDLGFTYVRADMQWTAVEKQRGHYDFSAYDRFVDDATKNGLHCYFALDYDNPLYGSGFMVGPISEEARRGFANFAYAAATRYRGRGFVWEIWNEPNADHFWQPKSDVAEYSALAKMAAQAIRRAGIEEKIVLPATSGFDWKFLTGCFQQGLLAVADGVSVHPYRSDPPSTVVDDWSKLAALVDQYKPSGKHIQLICGEWGYPDTEVPARGLATEYTRSSDKNLMPTDDPRQMSPYWFKSDIKAGQADPQGGKKAYRFESGGKPDSPGKDTSGVLVNGKPKVGHYYTVSGWFRTASGSLDLHLGLADSHVGVVRIGPQWERQSLTILARWQLSRIFQVYETTPHNTAWYMAFPQVEETGPQSSLAASRTAHGDTLVQMLHANSQAGVKLTIIYAWRDLGEDPSNREHHFGIFDAHGNAKPAVQKLEHELKKP